MKNKQRIKVFLLTCFALMSTLPITVFADTDPMEAKKNIKVDSDLVRTVMIFVAIVAMYFFSKQLQRILGIIGNKISKKIGTYSVSREYILQRYVYQHPKSPLTKLYNFVNEQLIALGYKRLGITVMGYLIFWLMCATVMGIIVAYAFQFGVLMYPVVVAIVFACTLVMTRVMVSERMELREADVMNAVDLIVPEVGNGVKNAIVTYIDNFAPSIRDDFKAFVNNIQERGFTFDDAMFILQDNLGIVFKDFAQKAIYYEHIGEKDMLDIFSDITETNRLRRQLRSENAAAFMGLKSSFIVSSLLTGGYFIFIVLTDDFSRNFFLHESVGKALLLVILLVVFGVLSYITTIKSRTI